jgi:hypothetical protein
MIIEKKYILECRRYSTDPWQKWGDENYYYNKKEVEDAYKLFKEQIKKFEWRIIRITHEVITCKEDA